MMLSAYMAQLHCYLDHISLESALPAKKVQGGRQSLEPKNVPISAMRMCSKSYSVDLPEKIAALEDVEIKGNMQQLRLRNCWRVART